MRNGVLNLFIYRSGNTMPDIEMNKIVREEARQAKERPRKRNKPIDIRFGSSRETPTAVYVKLLMGEAQRNTDEISERTATTGKCTSAATSGLHVESDLFSRQSI